MRDEAYWTESWKTGKARQVLPDGRAVNETSRCILHISPNTSSPPPPLTHPLDKLYHLARGAIINCMPRHHESMPGGAFERPTDSS